MTWEAAEREWLIFLGKLEAAKFRLNCTWSNAWFRGHMEVDKDPLPRLHRMKWVDIPIAERPRRPPRTIYDAIHDVWHRRRQIRKKIRDYRDDPSKEQELDLAKKDYRKLTDDLKHIKYRANIQRKFRPLLRAGERDLFIKYQARVR